MAAIKHGYLKGFKGLTAERANAHIRVDYATEVGYICALPKGVWSTTSTSKRGRPKKSQLDMERDAAADKVTALQSQVNGNKKTHLVFMTAVLANDWIVSDQTGTFPRTSNRGNKYMCVFYIFDPNFIKGVPIKSRHKEALLRVYQIVYKWCETRGFKPQLHKMDNETSKDVEEFITEQHNTKLQYTAPDRHCHPAEKAVQTYKATFKFILVSLPKQCPISYWCRLLTQTDLSINIVRPCHQTPLLSAWAAMEGNLHFGATPVAPPGSEML